MSYSTIQNEEIALIKFIAKYQYLNIKDVKYFFKTKDYYRREIRNLIDKKILRKIKSNLVLDKFGIYYAKLLEFDYNKINRNAKYVERLVRISSISAFYINSNTVQFTPSYAIKDKNEFTTTGRRYIGIFNINGIEYLTYQICKEHDKRYIASVTYDIQKEKTFKNIIILIDDINRININDFVFGMHQVLIINDTEESKEKLKYINNIDWSKIIKNNYKSKVHLSEYNFCDYTNCNDKFISTFYFIDTEKINKINYFLRENKNNNADIVCSNQTKEYLQKILPTCNYLIVNLEDYIDKELIVYD